MRLQSGGVYDADIGALCGQIRANGTRPVLAIVPVTHPQAPGANLSLYVNLAYQANGNLPPINGSLYTVGFINGNGSWHFNVGAIGVALPGVAIPGALSGDYASLGYALSLPAITAGNLLGAVQAVSNYNGTSPVPGTVLDGLARLIIAINEASRFSIVLSGVDGVLSGAQNSYAPPYDTIHNWGGHFLSR